MASDYPQIVVLSGPEEGQEYTLPVQGFMRMGRAPENDLVLSDNSVSRHHARITVKDGKCVLQDEGSSNGTQMGGKALQARKDYPLTHMVRFKVGIYEMQYLEHEAQEGEEEPPAIAGPVDADAEQPAEEVEEGSHELIEVSPPSQVFKGISDKTKMRVYIAGGVFFAVVLAIVAYAVISGREDPRGKFKKWDEEAFEKTSEIPLHTLKKLEEAKKKEDAKKASEKKPEPAKTEEKKAEEKKPEVVPVKKTSEKTVEKRAEQITLFLDIRTSPFPANIYLGDKRLGKTPLRRSVTLEAGKEHEVFADFELRHLGDIYREKKIIKPLVGQDVMDIKFDAAIGQMKVKRLPRRSEFYLEGHYDYDTSGSHPVKISNVTYGRPIFLPYGKYLLELKERTRVSGSTNLVSKVRYQREYIVNADNPEVQIYVQDKDLKVFPALIKSNPQGATLYKDDKKIGVTPFEGYLPVGSNELTLRKDGFFDKALTIEMPMNSVYETIVELETSKVGRFIQEAKEYFRLEQDEEGIHALIEALKYGGSAKEKAEVYFLLADAYLRSKQDSQAEPYYRKAIEHADFKERANLGLARVLYRKGQVGQALEKIAEVMVSFDENTPQSVKQEANTVFRKVSPAKSVIYLYSEPKGARVFLNDDKLDQTTPLILSGLSLGTYRLQVEKPGYQTYNTKQSLKFNDFVVIKIKLKPQNL